MKNQPIMTGAEEYMLWLKLHAPVWHKRLMNDKLCDLQTRDLNGVTCAGNPNTCIVGELNHWSCIYNCDKCDMLSMQTVRCHATEDWRTLIHAIHSHYTQVHQGAAIS